MVDRIITNKAILKTKSRDITEEELIAYGVVDRLKASLNKTKGIGLSAIQIGLPFRVCTIRWAGVEKVFINPKIVRRFDGIKKDNEGCLSLPGITKKVKRFKTVEVLENNTLTLYRNFFARIIQHEFDHFDGVLIDD